MKDLHDLKITIEEDFRGELKVSWVGTMFGELHGNTSRIMPIDDYPFAIIQYLFNVIQHIKRYEEKLRGAKKDGRKF